MGTDWIMYFTDMTDEKQKRLEQLAYRFNDVAEVFHFDTKTSAVVLPRTRKLIGSWTSYGHMWWMCQDFAADNMEPDSLFIESSFLE